MSTFKFQGTGQTTGGGDGLAWAAVLGLILIGGGGALAAAVTEVLIAAAVITGIVVAAAAVLLAWWLRKGLPAREARAAGLYAARVQAELVTQRQRRADRELADTARQAAMVAAVIAALNPPQPQPQPVRVIRQEVER